MKYRFKKCIAGIQPASAVSRASRLSMSVQSVSPRQIHDIVTCDIIRKKVSGDPSGLFRRGIRPASLPPYIYYIFRCHIMSLCQKPRQQGLSCVTFPVSFSHLPTPCHPFWRLSRICVLRGSFLFAPLVPFCDPFPIRPAYAIRITRYTLPILSFLLIPSK
jgi:hypothetical protein